ncbi:MAG: hypothetical protein COB05_04410 [Marinobacter sp.]|nr:MAG: hypothetical protein COB05_04410 [Marinobacter sp.]
MYCSAQDMIDRFGERELIELTDRDHTGVVDQTVIRQAIQDATAEVDGYLAGRYQLPLSQPPLVLVRVCCDIARFLLYDDNLPEVVEKRHKSVVDLLRQVSSGRVSLGVSETGQAPTSSDGARIESGGSVWSRRNSKGFL